jgi:hypothetical protein
MTPPYKQKIYQTQHCKQQHKQYWCSSTSCTHTPGTPGCLVYRHKVSQEERPIFWEVIVTVILRKKVYMYMCPIPNGFRDRAISLYSSKIVDKKEILRTDSNTGIYCSSYKVGTVYLVLMHFRKFHRQHHCTSELVWGNGVLLVCTVK